MLGSLLFFLLQALKYDFDFPNHSVYTSYHLGTNLQRRLLPTYRHWLYLKISPWLLLLGRPTLCVIQMQPGWLFFQRWGNRFTQERSQAKQNIDCKLLKCALPVQLSFLTSHNCAQQGCSYPPPKHLAPPGTGYRSRWSAGLGCYGNSWLPELFIFPLQWPTKRCTGSSVASCH